MRRDLNWTEQVRSSTMTFSVKKINYELLKCPASKKDILASFRKHFTFVMYIHVRVYVIKPCYCNLVCMLTPWFVFGTSYSVTIRVKVYVVYVTLL